MELDFASRKLQRQMESEKELNKAYGQLAGPIKRRLGVLAKAPTLADVPVVPPERCHLLIGKLAGRYAVDLSGNWRLIFRPDHDPVPEKESGGVDLTKVTSIVIEGVEDYHGK